MADASIPRAIAKVTLHFPSASAPKLPRKAWVAVNYGFGNVAVPVQLLELGPKQAKVELLVAAKMPSSSKGRWCAKGERLNVPRNVIGGRPTGDDLVLDGRGGIASVNDRAKKRGARG